MSRSSTVVALFAALICVSPLGAAAQRTPHIRFDTPSIAIFGGEEFRALARVSGTDPDAPAQLAWSVHIQDRVVQRGERVTEGGDVGIPVRLPEPDPGRSIPVVLKAEIRASADAGAVAEMRLHVFSRSVFEGQTERLRALAVRLFDPVGETARRFEEAGLPFVRMRGYDPPPDRGAVWIVGEGVSFADYRGLFDALVTHAREGGFVVCLAPSGGTFEVPGLGARLESMPARLALAGEEIVRRFDKRLDSPPWAGCKSRHPRFAQGPGGRMTISEEAAGWRWLEVEYERGAFYLCGLPVIACWNANPSACYLFASLLELIEKRRNSL